MSGQDRADRLDPPPQPVRGPTVRVGLARGASTRRVAQGLNITSKTAETHIERIYAKTGASTRSTITLFAMRNGLLDSFEPLDP